MANKFDGIDFSKITDDFNPMGGIQRSLQKQQEETEKLLQEANEHTALKDAALFETAEASVAQKDLLAQQVNEAREQNKLLKENYTTLKALYDITKREADDNAKSARNSKIFGWVSFGVGTSIGIVGVVMGILV